MVRTLYDELKFHILDFYHPLPKNNLKFIYYTQHYKQKETYRYKKFNADLLNNIITQWGQPYIECFHIVNTDNIKFIRDFMNLYYGAYDEYYYISLQAAIDDIKSILKYIEISSITQINIYDYNRKLRLKKIDKLVNKNFNKDFKNVNALLLNNFTYYKQNVFTNHRHIFNYLI